jgi:hypothetical protein
MRYPDLRPSVTGHWPRRLTDVPMGQPVLGGRDILMGWVQAPNDGIWQPHDLIWRPPGTRAMDLAGEIVDVKSFPGFETRQWLTAQLKHRDRWLDLIRQRVMDGTYTLTAALAKMLGLPFADGALLETRDGTRPESLAGVLRAERQRFSENVGRMH